MVELSLEIPTLNEAGNIVPLIERLENLHLDMEIIIIDDGSTDGTIEYVNSLSQKYKNIKLVARGRKMGLGSAVIDGLKVASGNLIAVMDGDLQHPPEILKDLYEKISQGYDVVVASRYSEGVNGSSFNFMRKLISRGATTLAHVMLRDTRAINDPLSGYFIFRKDAISLSDVHYTGYKILLEILARNGGRRIAEVPYTFGKRTYGKSKLGLLEELRYLVLLFRLSGVRVFKFGIVGLSGVLVNEGLLYVLHSLGLPVYLSGAAAIEVSILSNFVVNDNWTFKGRKSRKFHSRLLRYNALTLLGGSINYAILLSLTSLLAVHYLTADFIGIIVAFAANYLGSELLVWDKISG